MATASDVAPEVQPAVELEAVSVADVAQPSTRGLQGGSMSARIMRMGEKRLTKSKPAPPPVAEHGGDCRTSEIEHAVEEYAVEHLAKHRLPANVGAEQAGVKGMATHARHAMGLYTRDERAMHDYKHAMAKLKEIDKDHDGHISKEEMMDLIHHYCATEHDKHAMKRSMICLTMLIVLLVVSIVSLTTVMVYSAKDTTVEETNAHDGSPVGAFLTKFEIGEGSGSVVATAAAEDIWEVEATVDAFDQLQSVDAFSSRPQLVIVKFNDTSVVQFPPEYIQSGCTSAPDFAPTCGKIANSEVGITLNFEQGAVPNVVYHGGTSRLGFAAPGVPGGPTAAAQAQDNTKALRVQLVQLLRPSASNINKLTAKTSAVATPQADAEAGERLAAPQLQVAVKQREVAQWTHAMKALIPFQEQDIRTRASIKGRCARKRPDAWWLVGCKDVQYAQELCTRFENGDDFAGKCGVFGAGGELAARFANITRTVTAGLIPITASKPEVNKFREAMREEGNPCGFTFVQKEYQLYMEGVGNGVTGGQPTEQHGLHPAHEELQRSLRAHVASTPAGEVIARRKARELYEAQVAELGEEEHRRRLADAYFHSSMYTREGKIVDDLTCYRTEKPGAFRGKEDEVPAETCSKSVAGQASVYTPCRYQHNDCVPWEEVLNHEKCRVPDASLNLATDTVTTDSPLAARLKCLCDIVGGVPRDYADRNYGPYGAKTPVEFDGAFPRALCKDIAPEFAYLGDKPYCFYRQASANNANGIATGKGLVPSVGRVSACFADYYNLAKNAYACTSCAVIEAPFDRHFAWQLARLGSPQNKPTYENRNWEQAYNDMIYDGSGVHVFVIDTGVYFQHADIEDALGDGVDARNPDAGLKDCKKGAAKKFWWKCNDVDGHGTHVAGLVAGKVTGIARGVTIHPVRIGNTKEGTMSGEVSWWVVDKMAELRQQKGAANVYGIVTFSQGTNPGTYSEALEYLLELMLQHNISVVTSAGNVYRDSCEASPNRIESDSLSYGDFGPKSGLVVAGATNIDDSRGWYSNWGACITAYAPGTSVLSLKIGVGNKYVTNFGTSMACPVIVGVMALGAQMKMATRPAGKDPMKWLNPRSLKNWLKNTARSGAVRGLEPTVMFPDKYLQPISDHPDNAHTTFWSNLVDVNRANGGSEWFRKTKDIAVKKLVHVPAAFWKNFPQKDPLSRSLRRVRRLSLEDGRGVPRELQPVGGEAAGACKETFEVYDESTPCPPEGSVVCGDATGITPDGQTLQRPFRRVLTECADGCECDEEALAAAVRYESCAAEPCAYLYTSQECNTAFSISTPAEAAMASGAALNFAPLLDAGYFNEPTVSLHAAVDPRYAGGAGGRHELVGEAYGEAAGTFVQYSAPRPLELDDEAFSLSSIVFTEGFATSFPFMGKHYTAINVASNGYVTFGRAASITTESTEAAQFSAAKGPSFSLMLTDLEIPNAYVANLERVSDEPIVVNGTELELATPFATVVTYLQAEVATYGTEDAASKASAQAFFYHETGAVTLVLGQLPEGISATIGPASGPRERQQAGLVSISALINGELPSSGGTCNPLCDAADAAAEAEDAAAEAAEAAGLAE